MEIIAQPYLSEILEIRPVLASAACWRHENATAHTGTQMLPTISPRKSEKTDVSPMLGSKIKSRRRLLLDALLPLLKEFPASTHLPNLAVKYWLKALAGLTLMTRYPAGTPRKSN